MGDKGDVLPNTKHLINFDFTAPCVSFKEEVKEEKILLFANFPGGPLPLCLNPVVDSFDCGDIRWSFRVLTGNSFWVCGAVPLKTEEYLGEWTDDGPAISIEKEVSAAARTPDFFSRGKKALQLKMHDKDVEIVAKTSERKLEIYVNNSFEHAFSLKGEKWKDGFRVLVGCCMSGVVRIDVPTTCSIKPAKRG